MLFGFGKPSTDDVQDGADPSPPKRALTRPLDVVFLQDTTGSQGPYIQSARQAIRSICSTISSSAHLPQHLIRFGLVAFRDHPPQDYTYVTKNFGFTSDLDRIHQNLSGLIAAGGGDGPEAQTAALADALQMEWAEGAVKIVILITDSPPHGLGEAGDGFAESPDQNDPLEIARQMAERGITLFVIACEPALSKWKHALDFYTALTQLTSGRLFPLLQASKLGDFIVGTALETIETEQLVSEFEHIIVEDLFSHQAQSQSDHPQPPPPAVEDVVSNLQEYLKSKKIQVNTVVVPDDVYVKSEVASTNVDTWAGAKKLSLAKGKVKEVSEPRLQAQYAPPPTTHEVSPSRLSRLSTLGFSGNPRPRGRYTPGSPPPPPLQQQQMYAAASPAYANPMMMYAPGAPSASPLLLPSASSAESAAPVIVKQDISASQAHSIVVKSMARNSAVTSEGMTSRKTGKTIAFADFKLKKEVAD